MTIDRRKGSRAIPPGFTHCATCGEFTGSTPGRDGDIRVRCLCEGIPCPRCKINKIHRPISNSYDAETDTIEHWPYFSGMVPCQECKEREGRPLH